VVSYGLDAKGRRVRREATGEPARKWLYQDGLRPVAELGEDDAVVAEFVYASASNVPAVMKKAGKVYRLVTDHLGSVRLVVDVSTGAVAQALSYDAYGRVLADTAPGFQPFGFAGGLYDPATGLVRFGARDYDAVGGRWTTKDPVRFAGGLNLYEYAGSDPLTRTDPSGLFVPALHLPTDRSGFGDLLNHIGTNSPLDDFDSFVGWLCNETGLSGSLACDNVSLAMAPASPYRGDLGFGDFSQCFGKSLVETIRCCERACGNGDRPYGQCPVPGSIDDMCEQACFDQAWDN
jgi:RHS repeat-associated protein